MNRFQRGARVIRLEEVAEGTHVLSLECADIAQRTLPGQFVNVRLQDGAWGPLLRRPFSVSRVDGNVLELLFNIVGPGTRLMASRRPGDVLDLLGPLGKPFGTETPFETAILVGGGLGVAPFPILTADLRRRGRSVETYLGARTERQLCQRHLENVHVATDDGTAGERGTVVDIVRRHLHDRMPARPKIFGCGPTPMLKALASMSLHLGVECELSLEGDMACGIGICQGCPVERTSGPKKYALVCSDGPTFHAQDVRL